jgi:hypothetical protein
MKIEQSNNPSRGLRRTVVGILFLILPLISFSQEQKPGYVSANQKRIQGMLANLKPKADFEKMFFLVNDKGVEYYKNKLKNLKPEDDPIAMRYNLAEQFLLAGHSDAFGKRKGKQKFWYRLLLQYKKNACNCLFQDGRAGQLYFGP